MGAILLQLNLYSVKPSISFLCLPDSLSKPVGDPTACGSDRVQHLTPTVGLPVLPYNKLKKCKMKHI